MKESVVDQKGQEKLAKIHRMLVAMFPQGTEAWFFKLAGPTDRMADHADDFRDFVSSVRFEGEDERAPVWSCPENWKERRGGGQMRFATLVIPAELENLELSVIRLPVNDSDPQDYLLDNVNRWRGQMRLPPVDQKGLPDVIEQKTIDDLQVVFVDLIGNMQPAAPVRPPFVDRSTATSTPRTPEAGPTGHNPDALDCSPPDTWEPTSLGINSARYRIVDGDQQAIVNAMAVGGDLLSNMNRWRGQIQLAPMDDQQLADSLERMEVDGHPGHYIEMVGEDPDSGEAILGVVVNTGSATWFVKLHGDSRLALRERENFRSFAKSLRFK